tara:strand:- start:1816 stop:2124 length:309 start_codon:yes stop_codon:yes gene_type:complete
MGKKRRLKSAKAKFRAKHSNHPRMQHLNKETAPQIKMVEVIPELEAVLKEEKTETEPKIKASVEAGPKIKEKVEVGPKPKATKKTRRSSRKKATKKVTSATT